MATALVQKRFSVDGDSEVVFSAVRFDEPWNGWAVPVVDRATALAAIARVNELDTEREIVCGADGDVLVLSERCRDDGSVIAAARFEPTDGLYRLALGLTYTECV